MQGVRVVFWGTGEEVPRLRRHRNFVGCCISKPLPFGFAQGKLAGLTSDAPPALREATKSEEGHAGLKPSAYTHPRAHMPERPRVPRPTNMEPGLFAARE